MEKEDLNDILNGDGSLKKGVQIIEADTGEVVAEGSKTDEFKFKPGDDLYLGDEFSGDYCELRNCLLLKTRHKIVEGLSKMDRRRIILLREHLLQLAAYHQNLAHVAIEMALIICRLMNGDKETDLNLPDDDLDVGSCSDSDTESDKTV